LQAHQYLVDLILFAVLVGLSAFFSGAETAFLSLSRMQPSQLKTGKAPVDERLRKLHSRLQELLIAILVGNTLVNTSAATVAALLTSRLAAAWHIEMNFALFIEVVVVTLVLLVFSEITPKLAAIRNPLRFAARASLLIFAYINLIRPITFLLQMFTDLTSKLFGVAAKKISLDEDELRILVEVGEEHGALEEEEKEMIHSILEFGETQVKEVMVPRIDMVCVEKHARIDELIDLIKTKGHTRIPLYEEHIDNILGLIHAKDLLPYVKEREQKVELAGLARPILFVPESKLIDELLEEFQLKKIHMAIVVDEYGGTAGLVTLEDVLEEIVGEIQDEYDREAPLYKEISANTYLVNAKIDLHELNRELSLELPTGPDYESLGGFILSRTGSVPREKEVIPYKNMRFIVEKVERNRIVQVRVEIANNVAAEEGS